MNNLLSVPDEVLSQLVNPSTVAGAATVGVTAVRVLPYKLDRRLALITNDSALDIYIGLGSSVTINTGIRLNALGGSFSFGRFTDFPWLGEIWAVAAGAGCNLSFVEV